MPTICVFYGIVVMMYFADHEPPHVHVRYGEHVARAQIATGEIDGRLPARAARLVREWVELRQGELLENWALARSRQPLKQVAPLP